MIDRSANTLKLFPGTRLVHRVRRRHRAVGLPDAVRHLPVVDMQENPWWYPPTSSWAQGSEAGPARAGQPARDALDGPRAPGVGIHGTPDDASIGYSRSHGCIRMHIPDAEWLFDHVDVGTPVVIL